MFQTAVFVDKYNSPSWFQNWLEKRGKEVVVGYFSYIILF